MSDYKKAIPNPFKEESLNLRVFRIPNLASREVGEMDKKLKLCDKLGLELRDLNESVILAHAVGIDNPELVSHKGNTWSVSDPETGDKRKLVRVEGSNGPVYMGNFKPIGLGSFDPQLNHLVDYHTQHTARNPGWQSSRVYAFNEWCGSVPVLSGVKTNNPPKGEKDRGDFNRLLAPYATGVMRCAALDALDPVLLQNKELRAENYKQVQVGLQQWREHGYQGGDTRYRTEALRIGASLALLNGDPNPLRPPEHQQMGAEVASYRDELKSEQLHYEETVYRTAEEFMEGVLLVNCTSIYNEASKAGTEQSMPTTYPGLPITIDEDFARKLGDWPQGEGQKELVFLQAQKICYGMEPAKGNQTYGSRAHRSLLDSVYTLERRQGGKPLGEVTLSKDMWDAFRLNFGPTVNIQHDGKELVGRYDAYDRKARKYAYRIISGDGVKGPYSLNVDRDTHLKVIADNPAQTSINKRGIITDKITKFFDPQSMPPAYAQSLTSAEETRKLCREVRGMIEPAYASAVERFTHPDLTPSQQQKAMQEEMHDLFRPLSPDTQAGDHYGEQLEDFQSRLFSSLRMRVRKELNEHIFNRFHEELVVAKQKPSHPLHKVWEGAKDPESPIHEDAKFLLDGFSGSLKSRYSSAVMTHSRYDIMCKDLPEGTDIQRRQELAERYFSRINYKGVLELPGIEVAENATDPKNDFVKKVTRYMTDDLMLELGFVSQVANGRELPNVRNMADLAPFLKREHLETLATFRMTQAADNLNLTQKRLPYITNMRGDPERNIAPLKFSREDRKPMAALPKNQYLSDKQWSKIDDATKIRVMQQVGSTGGDLSKTEQSLVAYLEYAKTNADEFEQDYDMPLLETLTAGLRKKAGYEVTDPLELECLKVGEATVMKRIAQFSPREAQRVLGAFERGITTAEPSVAR